MPRVCTPPLPPDATPLKMQVSGHFYGKKATKLGMLELKDGTLVKPLIPPKGDKELLFYKGIFESDEQQSKDIEALRPILAQYYGIWTTPLHPGVEYMKLENVTRKFNKPCVLDVKVGPVTWGPDTPPDKKVREMLKYPPQSQVGFRLLGVKVYSVLSDSYMQLDHLHMRSLQPEDVLPKGILVYLNHLENTSYKREIIRAMIVKLKQVRDWFEIQMTYHFYATSLLFIYEGQPIDMHHNCESGSNSSNDRSVDLVDVRLIDFTHVYAAHGRRDDNYLTGVTKLLYQFEAALECCSGDLVAVNK